METQTKPQTIFNFDAGDLNLEPYPHFHSTTFLRPELFQRLKDEFPGDDYFEKRSASGDGVDIRSAEGSGGRTGRDFYSTDARFKAWLQGSPAWTEFYGYINSPEFIDFVMKAFGPHLEDAGCRIDPERYRYVEYEERPEELVKPPLIDRLVDGIANKIGTYEQLGVGDLYVRFDIEQGASGYGKNVHCDIANRVVSLVLYFSDADEIGMVGGDLQIHKHKRNKPMKAYERYPNPDDTDVVATVRPKENTGLLFLCSNNSYHSVTPITEANGYRKFIYLNVSSRASKIW